MKSALIIFVRNPRLGKVKTRLAAAVGKQQALEIYQQLLTHTFLISRDLQVDRYVFYDTFADTEDLWDNDLYHKLVQQGSDLGDKMKNATGMLFEKGYDRVILIGSDCLELSKGDIEGGFGALKDHDFVVGPALDGGYYLIGMKKFTPAIFEGKKWSTDSVYKDAIDQLIAMKLSFFTLRMLRDVDEIGDFTSL